MNIFEDRTTFGKRLRKAMKAKKINSRELSHRTGISESAISRYLSFDMIPRIDHAAKIAKALNVDPLWLFGMLEEQEEHFIFCPYCGKKLKNIGN